VIIDCQNDIARSYSCPLSRSTRRDAVASHSIVSNLRVSSVEAPMITSLDSRLVTIRSEPGDALELSLRLVTAFVMADCCTLDGSVGDCAGWAPLSLSIVGS
jgi:hypothetical protein